MGASAKHHKPLSAEFHTTIYDVPTAKEVEEVFIERQLDHFINQLNGYAHAHGIARTKREQVMAELEKHYPQEGWRTYGTLVYRAYTEVDGHNPKTKQDTRTLRKQLRIEKNLRLFKDKKPDLHPLIVHPVANPDAVTGHR
jgi:tRNA(His) 5'-end guanylyltransferase